MESLYNTNDDGFTIRWNDFIYWLPRVLYASGFLGKLMFPRVVNSTKWKFPEIGMLRLRAKKNCNAVDGTMDVMRQNELEILAVQCYTLSRPKCPRSLIHKYLHVEMSFSVKIGFSYRSRTFYLHRFRIPVEISYWHGLELLCLMDFCASFCLTTVSHWLLDDLHDLVVAQNYVVILARTKMLTFVWRPEIFRRSRYFASSHQILAFCLAAREIFRRSRYVVIAHTKFSCFCLAAIEIFRRSRYVVVLSTRLKLSNFYNVQLHDRVTNV